MNNNFSIKDKVVIITGAAGLLAEQHIEIVLENNAIGILLDINNQKLKAKKKFYLDKYKNAKLDFFSGDITDEKFIQNVAKLKSFLEAKWQRKKMALF